MMKKITVYAEDGTTVVKTWIGVGSSEIAGGPVPLLILKGVLSPEPIGIHALKPGYIVDILSGEFQ